MARSTLNESNPPKMIAVTSSNIAKVGYDGKAKELYVLFHSGDLYTYFDVPEGRAVAFMQAPSHGKYLHAEIKDRYECEKIKAPSWLTKKMPAKKVEEAVEYVVWGIPPGKSDEEVLVTRVPGKTAPISTQKEADTIAAMCTKKGAKRVRVQKLDMSTPPDFTKTLKKGTPS